MKGLTLNHVKHIAHTLAIETMSWNEPIPHFETRFSGKLESCLGAPFQTFGGKDVYPTFPEKVAVLFYLLINNPPFQNGNKRIAVTSLFVFLFINKRWLNIHMEDLYQMAVWVASSPPKMKDAVILGIKQVIQKLIIPLKNK